jgi:G:T/U-mismatch repair DNA glycosylase
MFHHTHPYKPFIPKNATKLIVGTLPPPRFTVGEFKEGDVDFCYGSRDGQLWPILERVFNVNFRYETTQAAIAQRKNFLKEAQIGICDIVASAKREKIDASDIGMQAVKLRDMVSILEEHPTVHTLLFTGGNSKNGPEYFFRRHLKTYQLSLKVISTTVPRIHKFKLPESNRTIQTISLTAPSGAANRAVGSIAAYKDLKKKDPNFNTIDFRVLQYAPFFN